MSILKSMLSRMKNGFFCLSLLLVACHQTDPHTLVVGTLSGPETELMDVAQKIAQERYGLTLKIVEFNDYNLPNIALQEGTLDANVYQHQPYLEAASDAHHYAFEVIGRTFLYPMGLYSSKHHTIQQLPEEALIAIPNDPSNETRALLMLANMNLLTFKHQQTPNLHEIVRNPKHLQLKEMDAAQLPRVLHDVDGAIINTTFALPAGLSLKKDALWIESKDSPYANLIVIRQNSTKKDQLARLVQALHAEEVKQKAQALFGEAAVAAW